MCSTKGYMEPQPIVQTTQQDLALMDITKKIIELEMKIVKGANKQPQMMEERTNIWETTLKI